ncbi:MAG: RNA polymerase sigma factor [Bacteroidota bacterium]
MKIVDLRFFRKKEKSIEEIVAGCCRGDASFQEMLFQQFAPILMTVCRRYEYPDFGASDILQESFLLIFKNISSFDAAKGSIETWMKKITVNTALKAIRVRKMNFLDIEEHHFQLEAETAVSIDTTDFSEEFLLEKIKELPSGYRTIFNLFVIEGYAHKEIAEILNIKVQTSKSQLSKAKKLLRKKLSEAISFSKNKGNIKSC